MGQSTHRMKALFAFIVILSLIWTPGLMDQNVSYSCPEYQVDFWGHDIEHLSHVADWHACGAMCELTSGCRFWSYGGGHCFLKNSDAGAFKDHRTSGARGCK